MNWNDVLEICAVTIPLGTAVVCQFLDRRVRRLKAINAAITALRGKVVRVPATGKIGYLFASQLTKPSWYQRPACDFTMLCCPTCTRNIIDGVPFAVFFAMGCREKVTVPFDQVAIAPQADAAAFAARVQSETSED